MYFAWVCIMYSAMSIYYAAASPLIFAVFGPRYFSFSIGVVETAGAGRVSTCVSGINSWRTGLAELVSTELSGQEALQKVREMMRKLQNDSSSVDLRPAAHLGILENGTLTGPDSEVPRVYWETSGKSSFITEGIEHGGDRLVIKRAGYYFIYTGLQFTVDPSTVSSGAIVSYVFRDNNNSKTSRRKLMTARESSCRSGRGDHVGPVSVYMAGIFLLHEKDEISVRTASHSLLHRSPATSYMGIHLL
ncbi:hypothetical protein BaRGS_00009484 [Batillaria attramentaria]|uniref:THD domain-containing protein n=1 Tax=Batillaria attramentaria TaxID=370345 RepID=A0ABD0LJS2_9CAEN